MSRLECLIKSLSGKAGFTRLVAGARFQRLDFELVRQYLHDTGSSVNLKPGFQLCLQAAKGRAIPRTSHTASKGHPNAAGNLAAQLSCMENRQVVACFLKGSAPPVERAKSSLPLY